MVCWFKSKSLDSKKPTRYFPFIIHMLITLRTPVFSMLLQSMLIVFPHLNHVIILILMILLFRDITFS